MKNINNLILSFLFYKKCILYKNTLLAIIRKKIGKEIKKKK